MCELWWFMVKTWECHWFANHFTSNKIEHFCSMLGWTSVAIAILSTDFRNIYILLLWSKVKLHSDARIRESVRFIVGLVGRCKPKALCRMNSIFTSRDGFFSIFPLYFYVTYNQRMHLTEMTKMCTKSILIICRFWNTL